MLQEIVGVSWSKSCQNCTLFRNFTSDTVKFSQGNYIDNNGWCRGLKFSIGKHTKTFAAHNFSSQCLYDNKNCYKSEIQSSKVHQCWDTDNDVMNLIYLFGSFDILLNVIVVVITLSVRCLRENVTMMFITNLAVGDVLIGVYGICITISRRALLYSEFESKFSKSFCPVIGFIWVLGAFLTVVTSVLLTYERYVVILYGLVPNKRIDCRKAFTYVVVSWILAIIAATLPVVGIGSYTTNTFCVPIQPSRAVPSTFAYSVGITLLGVLLYLSTIPLYICIFLYARKSGNQLGIRRDSVLARRIAVLVFSNMAFFFLPTIIGLLWQLTPVLNNLSINTRSILVGPTAVVLYAVNSFVNPLLYAYRNNRFKQVLRGKLLPRQNPSSSCDESSRNPKKNSQKTTIL